MKTIEVEIKGVAPLLQHRFPEEEHGVSASKSKQKVYVPEEECKKSLYKDESGQIYQPSEHVLGALIKAGVQFKFEGKKTYKEIIKGGILIEPDCIPLREDWVVDSRNVVVQRMRIMRYRPRFDMWTLKFKLCLLDENISVSDLNDILVRAGTIGLGDYRPRFGRFMVTSFKEVTK